MELEQHAMKMTHDVNTILDILLPKKGAPTEVPRIVTPDQFSMLSQQGGKR